MTMALTSNTWTRSTMSKLCNPDAMAPAIGANNGSGTGSVVSSASTAVLPCLLPASTGGGNEPDCEHNTNHLLRGLNSTLSVSDSLGCSCTISSLGGTFPPDSLSEPLSSTNAADLGTTNGASSFGESTRVRSWWMAAPPMLEDGVLGSSPPQLAHLANSILHSSCERVGCVPFRHTNGLNGFD